MLEILSTIGLTVSASLVIGFLAHSTAETPRGRLIVASALAAWFVLVLAIGAGGALDPTRGFGVPALGLTVALPVAALVGAFFASGSIRTAMLATPLPALVAVNTIRVLGVIFVLLYARGELPAPFAPSAGWGDIFIGITALPLAWAVMRFGPRLRPLAFAWNVAGIADLLNAIALGSLIRIPLIARGGYITRREIDHDHAIIGGHRSKNIVRNVTRMIDQRACRGVREHDG